MKILILTVTILNFVIYLPYNGSQEIHNQTNQHISASSPLSNHPESPLSSILSTEENSPPKDLNSSSRPMDGGTRISGSLSENLQDNLYNFPSFEDDALSNSSANQISVSFSYVEEMAEKSSQADLLESIASPPWDVMQDTFAVDTTIPSFAPNSQITQRRMTSTRKNSILAPVSTTNYQYKFDSTAIPHLQTNPQTSRSLEPFFPSIGRSKPFFASSSDIYIQNSKEDFATSAGESINAISNINNLLETGTTTYEDATGPDSLFFSDTTALVAEDNAAKIDTTNILEEDYIALNGVLYPEENIDIGYLERYSKTASNEPNLPKKENYIITDAININNDGRGTVNAQIPSIFSAKNSNDFESTPILNIYDRADTKSVMIATETDESIFNVKLSNATKYFLNARMYNERNNAVNSADTKAMIDEAKRDLIISKSSGITSTKHYVTPNKVEPIANTNMDSKITWPSEKDTITEGRHIVYMENIVMPNNSIITEATGSKVDDLVINYHSDVPANVHLQTDRNNFKSVSTDGIKNVTPIVEEIVNLDQDGEVVEVIVIHPDTSMAEIRRKVYTLNPDTDYTQIAINEITLPSENPVLNLLFKYKVKPFTTNGKSPFNNRGDHQTPTIITSNDAQTNIDFERTKATMFKMDNFQNNIIPIVSTTYPTPVGSVYFSEDSIPGMASALKVHSPSSDQYIDSVAEAISLSTKDDNADNVTGPKADIDFPMNKGYIFPSAVEMSKLMPNVQNNEAQTSLLIKDDSLTDAWVTISDPVAENPHLTNNTIIHKEALVGHLNIPLKSTFLTADFTSCSEEHNASGDKGITSISDSSERMTHKATTEEGRPTIATTSLPTKVAAILIPRKFRHLIGKKIATEEKSTAYTEVESVMEEDDFQIKEDIPPAHNFKYFEPGDSSFERKEFVAIDNTNSISQFSIISTAEITVSERDIITPVEKNVNALYDTTNSTNDKIYFKPVATTIILNSLGESTGVNQNGEIADDIALPPPSNSILQTGRMSYSILPDIYNNIITDNLLADTEENPTIAWNTIKNKLSLSTLDNEDLIDHRDGDQIPTGITSSNSNRLTNTGKVAENEITNTPLGTTIVVNDIFNEDKHSEVVTNLAPMPATSPITIDTLTMNEVNTLNNKPDKVGESLTISREDPNVSKDNGTILIDDSSAFMKSETPLNHPQKTKPLKKNSLADIIIPQTYFHNKATPKALKVAVTTAYQGDVETMFYIPSYELENSFTEDITLNFEADLQKEKSLMAEEEDIFQEENVSDYIYIIPTASDRILKDNSLTAKYYSTNSDVYDPARVTERTRARDDQPEFGNPAPSYVDEISKSLLQKFTPKIQRKVIVKNNTSSFDHDELFGSNILYPVMKENVLKEYIFSPERESPFTIPDFTISMENDLNPKNITKGVTKTKLMNYLNQVNAKMPPNTIIILSNAHAFEPKESFENSDTTISNIDGVLDIKSLLAPNQKLSRTKVPISKNYEFLSDTGVIMSESLELLSKHPTISDPNWKVINEKSSTQPFDKTYSVSLVNSTTFLEKPINTATDTQTTENGGIADKTDTMTLSFNKGLQTIIHKQRRINKISDNDLSHYVNQTSISPSAKEIGASGTEANTFLSEDKAIVDKESSISKVNTPVNLRELNTMKSNNFIFNPEAGSIEQKSPRDSKQTFYLDSTKSTAKLAKVKAKDSFSLNNNLEQSVINSYNKLYYSPLKSTLSPISFIENGISKLDQTQVIGESNIKRTKDSTIPNDIIVLPDNKIVLPDNIIFIENTKNVLSGKKYLASAEKDPVTQYEIIPFTNDFSAESDTIFLSGEGNPNNMYVKILDHDDSTLQYVWEESTFSAEEEGRSPKAKKTTFIQSEIYGEFGSPAPVSNEHVDENLSEGNPKDLKSTQKHQVVISTERNQRNPDPDHNIPFSQDYISKFYSKSPHIMSTYLLKDGNVKFSPKFPDDLTLESGSLSVNSITIFPEGKWIEHIDALEPESTVMMEESRTFSGEIIDLTKSLTPVTNREQLHGEGISSTTFNVLREAKTARSPKYNQNKMLKLESSNSQDIIVPSVTFNTGDELSLVYEDPEAKVFKDLISVLPIKTIYTKANIPAFPENNYEGSDSILPHENNFRDRDFPFLRTENIILIPKSLTKNSILMQNNPLTNSSKSVSVPSEEVTEYLDVINEIEIPENQSIKIQRNFHSHSLYSVISSRTSAIFIRNSTIDDINSSSSVQRKTVDIPKIKTYVHPQGTIIKTHSPKQISHLSSRVGEMATPSLEQETTASFDKSYFTNAAIHISSLDKALPLTSEPSTLSKSNNSEKAEEIYMSVPGSFVLRNTHTLKHNPFIGKFNISAGSGAFVSKNSTNNSSSKALRSMTNQLTHTPENIHKFLDKMTPKGDILIEGDTIIILPEDKRIEDILVLDPKIMVTTVERRVFPDETIDPIVINSLLENENHKFNVIPDGEPSFITEDIEVLSNRAPISFSPMNVIHTMEDTVILTTENSYEEGDSMLPKEDHIGNKEYITLQIHEKPMFIPNTSTENLDVSGSLTSNLLNSLPVSDTFETISKHTNSDNSGDIYTKNKNDLKSHSFASTNLPFDFISFSDNPINNEFDSVLSTNTETIDISKIQTPGIYSESQIIFTKALSPTKISQYKVFEERKINNLSDQEDPPAKFSLSYITNEVVPSLATEEILPSVNELDTFSENDNNVEEEVHISEADNFSPKDANTLKGNSFTIKFNSTGPQTLPNLKETSSVNSVLTLPKVYNSNYQSSFPEVSMRKETITNIPSGAYGLQWKPTLLSDFTTSVSSSSSKYFELDPVIIMEKDPTTTSDITPEERNTLSDRIIKSPTIPISRKGMKDTVYNRRFGYKTFIEKSMSAEEVPSTESISEESYDTLFTGENISSGNITNFSVDSDPGYVADNYVFSIEKEGNDPFIEKITLTSDSNVFESPISYASALVPEYLFQENPVDVNTDKTHQHLVPNEENDNSGNVATVLKSSTANFNTKDPRSVVYSLVVPSWTFSSDIHETILENDPLLGDNTIIILPKDKGIKSSLVSNSELMSTMEESRMYTGDPIDPAMIIIPVEYMNQFNRKGISSTFYNSAALDVAKATTSTRFSADKHKTNLVDMPYSQNNIISFAEFNGIPDDDLLFLSKDTEEANNRASIFPSSMNKEISTVADSTVLSTEDRYAGDKSMLLGEDNIKYRVYPSLSTSSIFIPNSFTKNSETSGLMRNNSHFESSITNLEMSERISEYDNTTNGENIPKAQVIITQSDIHSYPLPWNVSPMGSTFLDSYTDGEVDSFVSISTTDNYKTESEKTYSKSQREIMKTFSFLKESQNRIYKRRKVVNLSDQEDPVAKFELSHIKNTKVLIPVKQKIFLTSESNPLSNSDNTHEEIQISERGNLFLGETSTLDDGTFTVKFDATSFKSQEPPNLKGIIWNDATLTFSGSSRPNDQSFVSRDKVANTGESTANMPTESYTLHQRSVLSPSEFTFIGTPEHSARVPVSTMGKDHTKKIDYNIPPEEAILPSNQIIILPLTISSEKDSTITLNGNIFENKDFREIEIVTEHEVIDFTGDISEKMDDMSSVGKITPAYVDHTIITAEDSDSKYVPNNYVFG